MMYSGAMKKLLSLLCLFLSIPLFAAKKPAPDPEVLFRTVETGSLKEIRKLLKSNNSANTVRDESGETLLMAALRSDRDLSIIRELIDAGADVSQRTQNGKTALMYACQYQTHEKAIKAVIDRSATFKPGRRTYIQLADADGWTAFEYAKQNPNPSAVLKVLTKYTGTQTNVIVTTYDGEDESYEAETPLMGALRNNADIARIYDLLNSGADVSRATESGVTPLMLACRYETHENVIVTIIEKNSALKRKQTEALLTADKDGKTAFDYAMQNTDPPWVIDILERYIPNPDPVIYVSRTRLEEQEAAVAQAEPKAPPPEEETTQEVPEAEPIEPWAPVYLFDYAELDHEPQEITAPDDTDEERFKHTFIAEPDTRDSAGRTLLMKAVRDGNTELVEDLLYSEADVQLKDNDGWTALMFAARFQDDASMVRRLLRAGADQLARNNYGLTALTLAAGFSDNPDIVSLLLESRSVAEKEIRETFIYAITSGASTDILALFLEKGISLNAPYNGKTPLMYAAETNTNTRLIAWLLKHGAKATYRTTTGMTAFDFARKNSQLPRNEVYWSLNALAGGER